MSDYCLDGLQTTTKSQNNNKRIKDKQSNGKENKRENKNTHKKEMVIFDQVSMMPTLGINATPFLNQTL